MKIQDILQKLEIDDRADFIEALSDANVYLAKILDYLESDSEDILKISQASDVICRFLEECE